MHAPVSRPTGNIRKKVTLKDLSLLVQYSRLSYKQKEHYSCDPVTDLILSPGEVLKLT